MTLQHRVIAVTGGAGGLGAAMVRQMTLLGATVWVLDINEPTDASERFLRCDVTSEDDWQAAMSAILARDGRLDVLVNNAGINIRKPIEEMILDEWMTMFKVNTGSAFLGTKLALPIMRAQGGGAILNMASVCGIIGHRYTPEAYTATKGAMVQLTRSIAARYGKDGIRCNAICPSTVDTPMVQVLFQNPDRKAERLGEVPLGRLATVDDVAHAACFLASDEASFLNGVILPVDGGATCC